MSRSCDVPARQLAEVVQLPDREAASTYSDFKHLIEVAIVERSIPSDAHERPAHEAGHSCRIEVLDEQSQVVGLFSPAL